ncbi:MAG: FecR domain-containing protein [Acidobacteriota bacterium]|nr:FecR domain-containing protein [Acidobacteriota bacterium]
MSRISSALLWLAMTAVASSAQSITSAHSGTLHYFEGDVSIDGAQMQSKVGRFSAMNEQGVLRTAQGRAEVLLTPGVFLRIAENSAVKLLDSRLVSTRVELLSGSAMLEADDPGLSIKNSPVTLICKDYQIQILKHGLAEIGTDPEMLKVFKGAVLVNASLTGTARRATVKEGRELPFSSALLTEKFDDKVGDDLYLWTRARSQSLSAASMASARSLNSSQNGYGSGSGQWNGGGFYNSFFDMYTYVPVGGTGPGRSGGHR